MKEVKFVDVEENEFEEQTNSEISTFRGYSGLFGVKPKQRNRWFFNWKLFYN